MSAADLPPGGPLPPEPAPEEERRQDKKAAKEKDRKDRKSRDANGEALGDQETATPESEDDEEGDSDEGKLSKKERKRLKKLRKAIEEAGEPLDAWERYRALMDAFDMEQDLVDLADHKARFALIIMGALNTVTLFVGTRGEAIALVPHALRPWIALYVGAYALVALYFFIQAIESLRPRAARPSVSYPGEAGREDHPLGVRFYEDVLTRDVNAFRDAWRNIHLGQLNAEVSQQVHLVAKINKSKYAALKRLYGGLKAMTLLAAALVSLFALAAFSQSTGMSLGRGHAAASATPAAPARGSAAIADAGAEGLESPTVFVETGVLEPSGVAFDPRTGHLWVVGDEGSLVEIDTDGRVVSTHPGKGNLEDVAWHPGSGLLVLLSEKKSQLLLFDTVAGRDVGKIKLDAQSLLDAVPGDENQGFEGLAFRPEPGRPGGGVFYLTHQRQPAMLVAVSFDPQAPPRRLGAESMVARFKIKGYKDLTAVTWSAELGRLLVIGDDKDRLLLLAPDGALEAELPLPGLQQEGLAFDATGRLWVADDRGGVLRFDGALDVLRRRLQAGPTGIDGRR